MSHSELPPTASYATNLSLQHGHIYRLVAVAQNGVGVSSPACVSSSVVVDVTPPVASAVRVVHSDFQAVEEPTFEASYQTSTKAVRIALNGFEDLESELEGFYITVKRTDGWILAREVRVGVKDLVAFPVDLRHGQAFRVSVRAKNFARLETAAFSLPVTVDTSPPIISYVADYARGNQVASHTSPPPSTDIALNVTPPLRPGATLRSHDPTKVTWPRHLVGWTFGGRGGDLHTS